MALPIVKLRLNVSAAFARVFSLRVSAAHRGGMPWEGAARQLDSRTFLQVLLPETLSFYYRSKPHDRHCRRNPGSHDRFTSFPGSVVADQEEKWQQPVRGAAQAKAPGQYARFPVADGRQWARRADKAADDHSDRAPVAAVPHRAPNSHRNSVT